MLKSGGLIVLFCFLISSCSCEDLSFSGLWTNNVGEGGLGGNFSICVTGNSANGLYSEFGLSVGTLSNNGTTWTGNYYEGGNRECSVGVFSVNLIDNGTRFEGYYGCREKLTYKLSARRINNETQSYYDCAQVIDSTARYNILDGTWFEGSSAGGSQVDFCTDSNGGYQTSYFHPTYTPEGYDYGTWYGAQKIAAGVFYRANNNGALPGYSIWFINPDGNLVNIWWAGLSQSSINIAKINDSRIHSYDIYEYTHGTTTKQCSRFSALSTQKFDYYPYASELFDIEPFVNPYPIYYYGYNVNTTANSTTNANNGSVNGTAGNSGSSVLAYSLVLLVVSLLFC